MSEVEDKKGGHLHGKPGETGVGELDHTASAGIDTTRQEKKKAQIGQGVREVKKGPQAPRNDRQSEAAAAPVIAAFSAAKVDVKRNRIHLSWSRHLRANPAG